MIERLFLDRIDTKTAGTTVGRQHDLVVSADTDETQSTLPIPEFAKSGTQVALQAVTVDWVPITPTEILISDVCSSCCRLPRHNKVMGAYLNIYNEDGTILLYI